MPGPIVAGSGERRAVPVAPKARIATLDILRGFALLGMVLAHVHKTMAETAVTGTTSWVGRFITMGVAEKDRTVFAFLFGVGFAVLMRGLDAKGIPVVALYLRRLAGLYLIGFAVETLTRFSILREYAWAAVPLLFLRNFPTRSLLALALISVAALSIRDLVDSSYTVATAGQASAIAAESAQLRQWEAKKQAELMAVSGPNYGEVVAARFGQIVHDRPSLYHITPNVYLALFILGLLAVRHGVFDEPKRHPCLLVGAMVTGVVLWAAAWWALPLLPAEFATPRIALRCHLGLGIVDEQFLAFTLIGAITWFLAYRPEWQARLSFLGWVGRMALTNYLLHAVVIDLASSRYGLGLKLSPPAELLAAAVLFGFQIALSRFWFTRFRFGPVEWLWRSLTYWRWQPLRVTPTGAALAEGGG